ncbi:MAG: SAM-dependent methyltransferase [Actinomycetota bacterium]
MEAALYDPDEGFYARPPVGTEGHFVTNPHVSEVFGALVARQLGEAWDLLGEPDPFHVVEFAAGDGTLARQVLDAARGALAFAEAIRYLAVERTPGARHALAAAGLETVEPERLPAGLTGVVLANELLDNLPFRLVRRTDDDLEELRVGVDETGGFAFVPAPADDDLRELARGLEPGGRAAVGREPQRWLEAAAGVLERGWIVVFDYGGDGPRAPQTYRSHQAGEDLLRDPGSADITAGVDLRALAERGRELGLGVWGPVSQRDALLALGFGERAEVQRAATAEDRDAGRHLDAARRWARRSRESLLIEPSGLGGLQVMVFGVGVDRELAATRGAAGG